MTRVLALLLFTAGSLAGPLATIADAPLRSPGPSTECSPNGKVCIEMKPGSVGRVYRIESRGERVDLWVIPSWNRAVFLSDDGRHLVKCYGGLNLVPLDYDPEMSLVEVWRQGTLIHRLSLRTVVGTPSKSLSTGSHYAWGSCLRFESETHFVIALESYDANYELIRKKTVLDVVSGRLRRTDERIPW